MIRPTVQVIVGLPLSGIVALVSADLSFNAPQILTLPRTNTFVITDETGATVLVLPFAESEFEG
jgi:hypothetical protein